MPKDTVSGAPHGVQAVEPITLVEAALVIPRAGKGGFAVVDRQGAPVVDSLSFRKDGFEFSDFVDREVMAPPRQHAGTWLYAGECWSHFGHFIFESLSRLWALDQLEGHLDGLVFLAPHRGEGGTDLDPASLQARMLALLGVDLPVLVLSEPAAFERLFVPRQGCGMGGLAAGTPAHRRFLQARLRRLEPRRGVERLYLTRSAYKLRRGGIFGEGYLEQNLAAQGYAIYAPEQHPLEDQIATYLGARQIVAPDSSALHLFGFVARPDQALAIVLRRRQGAKDLLPQITGFSGQKPLVVDAIRGILARDNARIPTWGQFADLDFDLLGARLAEAGFLPDPAAWAGLPDWRRARLRRTYEDRLDCRFTDLGPDGDPLPAAA
jgi:hypothetical protein